MKFKGRNHIFNLLRSKHPFIIYESLNIVSHQQSTKITFTFNLSNDFVFQPSISFPVSSPNIAKLNETALQNLAFHLGMVELISYWKAACPPTVIIKPAHLTRWQTEWWKKLWFNGLGEFFYTNGIHTTSNDFLEIICQSDEAIHPFNFETGKKALVPVGGGKDSVVTLELLKGAGVEVVPYILNPRAASLRSSRTAGFSDSMIFKMQRTLDPVLLELNARGYLNGHTPFSALLAFATLPAAWLLGIGDVVLSNESSANEATIPGTHINHQYSKSFEFETDFRDYVSEFISRDFNYFSFLRPLNELQIAKLFAGFPQHYLTFRSCNAGSKTDIWCGKCSKCLFTRIILGPFIDDKDMTDIFGNELFEDEQLIIILEELTGIADEKPFECVGTVDEVTAALHKIVSRYEGETLPVLLSHYKIKSGNGKMTFAELLSHFNRNHCLPEKFTTILKPAIK